MTSFSAAVWLDGSPDTASMAATVARMHATMAHRPTDREALEVVGSAAFAVRERWSTPEAFTVAQPLTRGSSGQSTSTIFAGRLDNRAELCSKLGLAGTVADVDIVSAAVCRWGERVVAQFLGDFALLFWDEAHRRLLVARDSLGQRPLFWARSGGLLLVATELAAVLAGMNKRPAINEAMVGELLVYRPASMTETLWLGVERVPPAHTFVAEREKLRFRRYWDIEPRDELQLPCDEAYLEQYRDVFSEAVRCRLRAVGPVLAELSGGLDSSSVVGVAMQNLPSGTSLIAGILDHTRGGPADEAAYWQAVIDKWGLDAIIEDGERVEPALFGRLAERHLEYPDTAESPGWHQLLDRGTERGARVVLNGQWGDEWSFSTPFHAAEFAAHGHWSLAWAETVGAPRWGTPPERAAELAGQLLRASIAGHVGARLRPLAARARSMVHRTPVDPVSWGHVPASFRERIGLRERLATASVPKGFSPAKGYRYGSLHSGFATWMDELGTRSSSDHGLDRRSPFTDRRLVELTFALPETWFRSQGWDRVIQRRALAGALPRSVAQRLSKAHVAPTFLAQIEALGGRKRLAELTIVQAGWVDPDVLVRWYDAGLAAPAEARDVMQIWSAIAMDEWLLAIA